VCVRAGGSGFSFFVLLSLSSDPLRTVSHFTVRIISLSLSIFVCFLGFIWKKRKRKKDYNLSLFLAYSCLWSSQFRSFEFSSWFGKIRVSELVFLGDLSSFTSILVEIQFFWFQFVYFFTSFSAPSSIRRSLSELSISLIVQFLWKKLAFRRYTAFLSPSWSDSDIQFGYFFLSPFLCFFLEYRFWPIYTFLVELGLYKYGGWLSWELVTSLLLLRFAICSSLQFTFFLVHLM
jgi:hypothetical protein